jgi:hypothetical protein
MAMYSSLRTPTAPSTIRLRSERSVVEMSSVSAAVTRLSRKSKTFPTSSAGRSTLSLMVTGTSGNISAGAGKKNIADKQIDLTSVAQFQKDVDKYVNKITFQGCSVGKGADGKKFLKILADSLGQASAWNQPVTVVDRSYLTIGRSANFVTKDKSALPEPGTFIAMTSGISVLIIIRRSRRRLIC